MRAAVTLLLAAGAAAQTFSATIDAGTVVNTLKKGALLACHTGSRQKTCGIFGGSAQGELSVPPLVRYPCELPA